MTEPVLVDRAFLGTTYRVHPDHEWGNLFCSDCGAWPLDHKATRRCKGPTWPTLAATESPDTEPEWMRTRRVYGSRTDERLHAPFSDRVAAAEAATESPDTRAPEVCYCGDPDAEHRGHLRHEDRTGHVEDDVESPDTRAMDESRPALDMERFEAAWIRVEIEDEKKGVVGRGRFIDRLAFEYAEGPKAFPAHSSEPGYAPGDNK